MPFAQPNEAVVRLNLDHVGAVAEFHRQVPQASIQHRPRRDDESSRPGRPKRLLQFALDTELQTGRLGAHALGGIIPAGAAVDGFEHILGPHTARQGVDRRDLHRLYLLLQLVAALAGEQTRLQAEARLDDLAFEFKGLAPATQETVAVVDLHVLAGVAGRVHRAGIEQQRKVRQPAHTFLGNDAHTARQQMAHVDAIEHQARRPDHRDHRHDGDGLVPTSRRTVQLDGVQLGTIELHQTSSAVNDQV
ncbi:hypothetical protein D9M72_357640 [compost metagenome]